jgi:hypothetical protein
LLTGLLAIDLLALTEVVKIRTRIYNEPEQIKEILGSLKDSAVNQGSSLKNCIEVRGSETSSAN